jgi:hypothetical protein
VKATTPLETEASDWPRLGSTIPVVLAPIAMPPSGNSAVADQGPAAKARRQAQPRPSNNRARPSKRSKGRNGNGGVESSQVASNGHHERKTTSTLSSKARQSLAVANRASKSGRRNRQARAPLANGNAPATASDVPATANSLVPSVCVKTTAVDPLVDHRGNVARNTVATPTLVSDFNNTRNVDKVPKRTKQGRRRKAKSKGSADLSATVEITKEITATLTVSKLRVSAKGIDTATTSGTCVGVGATSRSCLLAATTSSKPILRPATQS